MGSSNDSRIFFFAQTQVFGSRVCIKRQTIREIWCFLLRSHALGTHNWPATGGSHPQIHGGQLSGLGMYTQNSWFKNSQNLSLHQTNIAKHNFAFVLDFSWSFLDIIFCGHDKQARPLLVRALEDENYDELVDPLMENKFLPHEMARMVACAAASIRHSGRRRPKMSQVHRHKSY